MDDQIYPECRESVLTVDEATITRMVGHFRTLMEGILADPEQHISQLPILTEAELDFLQAFGPRIPELLFLAGLSAELIPESHEGPGG